MASSSKIEIDNSKPFTEDVKYEILGKLFTEAKSQVDEQIAKLPTPESLRITADRMLKEGKTHLKQATNLKTALKEALTSNITAMHDICTTFAVMTDLLDQQNRVQYMINKTAHKEIPKLIKEAMDEKMNEMEEKRNERVEDSGMDNFMKEMKEYINSMKVSMSEEIQMKDKYMNEMKEYIDSMRVSVCEEFDKKVKRMQEKCDAPLKRVNEEVREQVEIAASTHQQVSYLKQQVEQVQAEIQKSESNIKQYMDQLSVETQNCARKDASYAQVVAAQPPTQDKFRSVHSIMVSSADPMSTGDTIMEKIRTAVDAKNTGIRVDRVRKAKEAKVILGCETREELERVKERIRKGALDLEVEDKANRDPLVAIRNVLSATGDEDVLLALKTQNQHLLRDVDEKDYRAKVKYRRRARNPQESHVILQVSPLVWQRLTLAGKLYIDIQRVSVVDQSPVVQCTRCLGFGHGRRQCEEKVDLCSHCGGPHMRNECPSHQAKDAPACRNCHLAKVGDVGHDALSNECPTRAKWDLVARARVAYC